MSAHEYKNIVDRIKLLKWEQLSGQDLQQLMCISLGTAIEFAEALRVTLEVYPNNPDLQRMADGELKTNNLEFGDYKIQGDHSEYLDFFIKKNGIVCATETKSYIDAYSDFCKGLDPQTRAMTIFSREKELSGIFNRILSAPDWTAPGLVEFKNYLERHISLDSDEDGHFDMIKGFSVDDNVQSFYERRLALYGAIPNLHK